MTTARWQTETQAAAGNAPGRRRRRIQSASHAIVWGIVAFVSLQACLALLAETWYPELRYPPFWTKVRRLQARVGQTPQPPLTVVMLGSSCTAFGFHGQIVERAWSGHAQRPVVAYNLGVYGHGPVGHLLDMQRLLRRGLRPDVVLIEVFQPKLTKQLDPSDTRMATMQYADLATVQRYQPDRAVATEWWQTAFCPIAEERVAILSGLAPKLLPWNQRVEWWRNVDPSGWAALKTAATENATDAVSPALKKWKRLLQKFEPGGPPVQALTELLDLCRGERIQAVLVVMPEGPRLRSLYPPGAAEKAERMLQELSRAADVPMINARAWLSEDAFLDSHHLNARGAGQFTARLAQTLQPVLASVQ